MNSLPLKVETSSELLETSVSQWTVCYHEGHSVKEFSSSIKASQVCSLFLYLSPVLTSRGQSCRQSLGSSLGRCRFLHQVTAESELCEDPTSLNQEPESQQQWLVDCGHMMQHEKGDAAHQRFTKSISRKVMKQEANRVPWPPLVERWSTNRIQSHDVYPPCVRSGFYTTLTRFWFYQNWSRSSSELCQVQVWSLGLSTVLSDYWFFFLPLAPPVRLLCVKL